MKKIIAILASAAIALPTLPVMAASSKPIFEADFSSDNGFELKNGAKLTENGKSGQGLYLDGVDDYALLPDNILSDNMTISAWVKQDKKAIWGRLFDFGTDSNVNFFFAPTSGSASRVEAKNGGAVDTMETPEFEKVGTWAYYTVTASPTEICLYRDGLLQKRTAAGNVKLSEMVNVANFIGKSHYEADAYFSGMIDDFKVYDRVLTRDEILADMGKSVNNGDAEEIADVYTAGIEDGMIVFGDKIELPNPGVLRCFWQSSDYEVINSIDGTVTPADENKEVVLTFCREVINENNGQGPGAAVYSMNLPLKTFTVTVLGSGSSPFEVNVNAADRSTDVSDDMWGLFFEDINSAADGGIYAEMVQNGGFEYPESGYSWELSDGVEMKNEGGFSGNNPTYITMPSKATASNEGYMGMSINANESYTISLYASKDAQIKVSLQGAEAVLNADGEGEWQKLSTTITPADKNSEAKLIIENIGNSPANVDFISLMPVDTYKGHGLRKDMCEVIEAMNPSFLRFPGGCAVEGRTMDVAWNWKDTVGPIEYRKPMENIWNGGSEPYIMSYGLGFFEYFQLCEDMDMEPVPILNCGMACQARSGGAVDEIHLVPMDELQPYIQDALDLIEFANGTDTSNKWVQLRHDMGHPEPFNMKYLGIGNEQWGEIYFERYEAFAKVIREKYPEIQLITTSGPASSGDNNDLAWKWIHENDQYADLTDEHYYEAPDWFRVNAHRYDTYKRGTTDVFLGEYASKGNAWYNALSEAAYMTGMERNADVVRMASYAPMFAKYGNTQWTAANMIWFNNDDLVLTPNYHVQSLFMNNAGDYSLDTTTELKGLDKGNTGGIVLGTWLTSADYKDLVITDKDGNVIYTGDFSQWEKGTGDWTVNEDGSVSQASLAEKCTLFVPGDYSEYTLTVKAKKTSGQEGFQVGVWAEDANNYTRINIGGWANTLAKVQTISGGASITASNYAEGNVSNNISVKDNEWQEIRVEVSGDRVEGYLDGTLACAYSVPTEYGPVYASGVYDEESGEVIVKIVNTAESKVKVDVNVNGIGYVESVASVVTMSADGSEVNTLENPDNVVPVEGTITNAGTSFVYEAAAESLSIIRLKTKGLQILEPGAKAEFYDGDGNRHEISMTYDNGVLTGVSVN